MAEPDPLGWRNYVTVGMIPAGSSVLDLGCGDGSMMELLEGKGCHCVGVDKSEDWSQRARKKGLNVIRYDIDAGSLPVKDRYDYVCVIDVLEHLHNPFSLLKGLRKIATFEIFSCLNSFWYRYRLAHLFGYTHGLKQGEHLWHWSFTSFRTMLEETGWFPEKVEILPGTPFIGRFSISLAHELAFLFPNLFVYGYVFLTRALEG